MKFGAVIFDLYDTLITIENARRTHYKLFNDLNLCASEITAARREYLTTNHHLSTIARRLRPKTKLDLAYYEELIQQEVLRAKAFEEVPTVLLELKKHHDLTVISNLATPYRDAFYNLGLNEYIDHVFFSCDLGMIKPEKKIYEYALQEIGISAKRVLMVGDSLRNDVQAPISCGIQALLLDRFEKSDYRHRISSLNELLNICK